MSVQSNRQIWNMPFALSLLTVIGLVSALLADDVWDAVSWIALSIPIVVVCRYVFDKRNFDAKSSR